MSNPIIGANIRLARLFHGLALEDVAGHMGKTRQYVHKIETEQIAPSDQIVEAIAKLTQVRPEFFVRPASGQIAEDQCHFRRHFTARAAVKHVALAKGEIFRRLVVNIETRLELPRNTIPQIDVKSLVEIEQAAESCRRHWGLGLGPIQNMMRLVENVGAVATSFKGLSREVDAYSISAARPIIVVNEEEASACRLRFDLAHELAHLILHVGTSTGDRKTEGEANRFAGAFLLPRSSFAKEFPRLRGSHLNWQGLSDMKLRWKVSKSALLYRAKQLSLISDDQYRTGVIRLNRGGEARVEREDGLISKEKAELFSQAVRLDFSCSNGDFEKYCHTFGVEAPIVREFLTDVNASNDESTTDELADRGNVVSLAQRRRRLGLINNRKHA